MREWDALLFWTVDQVSYELAALENVACQYLSIGRAIQRVQPSPATLAQAALISADGGPRYMEVAVSPKSNRTTPMGSMASLAGAVTGK
jgi:hypothetical protein